MKLFLVLILIVLVGCDSSVDPKVETIFYSDINKELFSHKLTAEVTTYIDTIFDSKGVYRIMELPEVKLFVDTTVFAYGGRELLQVVELIVSTNTEFTDTLDVLQYAGLVVFRGEEPLNIFNHKIKSESIKRIYIRLAEWRGDKREFFLIGINL